MSAPAPRRTRRRPSGLEKLVVEALDQMKAVDVKVIDVRASTDFADTMVIASGTSDRHVRAIAQHLLEKAREAHHRPLGVEGARDGEWVLVDLQDVVVHVMLPRVREFYAIEQLWERAAAGPAAAAGTTPGAGERPHRPRSRAAARRAGRLH